MKKSKLLSKAPVNPLDSVEYTGDMRKDIDSELTEMQRAYRDRSAADIARKTAATDSEYWLAVCFTSREEKEAFLKAVGIKPALAGDKYIDGRLMAAKLKVDLGG